MAEPTRATFITQYGSLQLGNGVTTGGGNDEYDGDGGDSGDGGGAARRDNGLWHLGNKRLGSLDRNWSTVEACVYPYDGFAPMPSRACFSVSILGITFCPRPLYFYA